MSYIMSEPRFALERRIPLALIFAIFLHLGAALIWAAQLDTRVARIERDVDRIGDRLELIPALVAGSGKKL
jgi:hypothetical protein